MAIVEWEESCSEHNIKIDDIGFIYRNTEIKHGSDGEMFVTLSGESVVSGNQCLCLSMRGLYQPIGSTNCGPVILLNSIPIRKVMPDIGGYSKISASERSWSNSNALPVRTCIFQIIFVHGLPYQ